MSGAVSQVSKGRFFKRVDEWLHTPTQAMLDQLVNHASLFEISLQNRITRASDRNHVEKEVFGNLWWPQFENKEKIIRLGYIEAISMSLEHARANQSAPLPIESWWSAGHKVFEVVLSKSQRQITYTLVTPKHPAKVLPPDVAFPEDMWVVSNNDHLNELRNTYGADYDDLMQVEELAVPDAQVKRLRLWGY